MGKLLHQRSDHYSGFIWKYKKSILGKKAALKNLDFVDYHVEGGSRMCLYGIAKQSISTLDHLVSGIGTCKKTKEEGGL